MEKPNFYCINKEKVNKPRCKEQCHFCKKLDNNHIDCLTGEPRKLYNKEEIPNQAIYIDLVMDDGSVYRRQVQLDGRGMYYVDFYPKLRGFYFIF